MPKNLKEKLFQDLAETPDVLFAMGERGVYVTECFQLQPNGEFRFSDGWLTIETKNWHVHINASNIAKAQFLRDEDQGKIKRTIHFLDSNEKALVRVYFRNLYGEDGKPNQNRVQLFEDLYKKYGSTETVVF